MKSVNEVSKLSGVSRRTLQYYDQIGLLPPSTVKESGYRLYNDDSLRRLWSILFYKELGFSLDEIRLLLDNPIEVEKEIMRQHKQILLDKQAALQKMIESIDQILNGKFDIYMLSDFDKSRIETIKKIYANEIRMLIESKFFLPLAKSGLLSGDQSLVKNASVIVNVDFGQIISLCGRIIQTFQEAMADGPQSVKAAEAAAAYRELLSNWIPCDDQTFLQIAEAYEKYKDEMGQTPPELGELVSEAIRRGCGLR